MWALSKRMGITLLLLLGVAYLTTANPIKRAECATPIAFTNYKRAPGYFVVLDKGYTMQQHFDKMGPIPDAVELTDVGYFAVLDTEQIHTVCGDPRVKKLEENTYGRYADPSYHNSPPEEAHIPGLVTRATAADVGYGLAYLSADKKFPPEPYTYHYLEDAGEGVDIYIIDSGVNPLPDFGDRLRQGKTYAQDGSWTDVKDHGTSVAGFAGSGRFGSAKRATIWSYKVHGSSDPTSDTVAKALQDIVVNDRQRRSGAGYRGAVINISMDLAKTETLGSKIEIAQANKIAVVVAAGNDDVDAKTVAPCSYEDVICVGAINQQYDRATFRNGASNWGSTISIMAPGHGLTGYHADGTIADDFEGTSFASPYVAGIAATFYGREGKVEGDEQNGFKQTGFSDAKAWQRLSANADRKFLGSNLRNSPDILANNGYQKGEHGYIGAPAPPAPPAGGDGQECNAKRAEDGLDCQTRTQQSTAPVRPTGAIVASNVVSILAGASTITQSTSTGRTTATRHQPTVPASPICWSSDGVEKPFPTNIASPGIDEFATSCKNTIDKPTEDGERAGCIVTQQPAQLAGAGDDDLPWINMSVEQIWWAEGQTSSDDVGGEISYVMTSIMSDCQTNDYDSMTIGGWTVTGSDETGYRRWNLTGLSERADTPVGFVVGFDG